MKFCDDFENKRYYIVPCGTVKMLEQSHYRLVRTKFQTFVESFIFL
jgi:hypothetical protein